MKRLTFTAFSLLFTLFLFLFTQAQEDPIESFEIADGFQIELVASEPYVADPVAMTIDEQGQIYVAEMPGYPLDVSGTGRIKLLKDVNNDGVVDESVLFADDIVLPTGIMRWKSGILVTAPPDVIYLEDTDGDNVADVRTTVLTGFARSNPQHNFNKPAYGLDNWIYLANNGIIWTSAYKNEFGDHGQEVHFPEQPNGAKLGKNANNRNVRFRPDTHEIESLSGRSQFGHTFDAWGHHFLVSNATPQYHEVIAARYLARNADLASAGYGEASAMQYTPVYGRNTTIYPITKNPEHQLLTDRGMITSAAGIEYYLGGLFAEPYNQVTFIAEPVHNLIHALKVSPKGATFEAGRVEERKEFLASTDSWFRPVNHYIGPDGALYVVDYYRQIVEHPEWMDDETAKSGKIKNGTEQGRIYRITPKGTPKADWLGRLTLDTQSPRELVNHLNSPNLWWRLNAQRLLIDQQATAVANDLAALLTAPRAETRVHALWTLDGLNQLTPDHIRTALGDDEAGVRENAIILAEKHAPHAPALWDALLALRNEPDARVRFQLLCTLGYLESAESIALRQQILEQDIEDPWTQLAALTTHTDIDPELFLALKPMLTATHSTGRQVFLQQLAHLIASNKNQENRATSVPALVDQALPTSASATLQWWQQAVLKGLASGLSRNAAGETAFVPVRNKLLSHFNASTSADDRASLMSLLAKLPTESDDTESDRVVAGVISSAQQVAKNDKSDSAIRAQAIALLALYDAPGNKSLFASFITPLSPTEVQKAAIQAYSKTRSDDVADVLLASWDNQTPEIRSITLDEMMVSQQRMAALLDAVESGAIQSTALGWDRTVILMRDTEGAVKDQARRLLSEPAGVRDQVVASYFESLTMEGDVDQGKEVFKRVCSMCHQMGGASGTAFGPDLATVRHWSSKALLAKILKPQQTIADGYGLWSVKLSGNQTEVGIISTESTSSIQLRRQGRDDLTIPRQDVVELKSLNLTAMPAGLETQLSRQEMAHLISFLRFN